MNMNQVRDIGRDCGVKPGRMKKQELIRAIQQAEGNPQCYNTHYSHLCGQYNCLWRKDCD